MIDYQKILKKSSKLEYRFFVGDCEKWFPKLDKKYKNKAKLIYLDPPYNTKRNGGSRSFFSDHNKNWKILMQNVLEKSYKYLKKNGFLIISINEKELFNLRNIADPIFKNGFVGLFPVKIRHHKRQLMINAVFHNVFEYLLIFRKDKSSKFHVYASSPDFKKFYYDIKILKNKPQKKTIDGRKFEIYKKDQYKITKLTPSHRRFREYVIAGKIATANWSGVMYERYLKDLDKDLLVKFDGLDKKGLGYRWFLTSNHRRKSGVYFQHAKSAGRPHLFTNFLDFTEIVPLIFGEGGPGCDFKDSKKPEQLIEQILEMTTKKNDLVMDFFGGSGTTLSSCIRKNRSCVIIEKNKIAQKTIHNRLKNMKNGQDLDRIKHKFKIYQHKL